MQIKYNSEIQLDEKFKNAKQFEVYAESYHIKYITSNVVIININFNFFTT